MENIRRFIEHTNLKPTLTDKDIDSLVAEGKAHDFFGVCVPPFWVKKARREIGKSDLQLVTVVGFPLGYQMTESKLFEIESAVNNGADEIDMVMNVSAFKSRMPWVKVEIAKCTKLVHQHGLSIKVIIETAYLNKDEILTACKICQDAGTDFVKTSTGFASGGAVLEDIKTMRDFLSDSVGIKASGGIKNLNQALSFIDAGADRLGTSSGVNIIANAAKN